MRTDAQELGENIRLWRKHRGMTLPALAQAVKTSKGNLSKIENGNGNPTLATLLSLCEALQIRIILK